MEEPLNGDGFGIAWYNHGIHEEPGLFVSVRPAWNDQNLKYLAKKIESNCFFAHVRAASVGWVSEANCHPFHWNNMAFMHNGNLGGFKVLKRYIRGLLEDELYEWIKGQTDSEHLFALFLHFWKQEKREGTTAEMAEVLEETIKYIVDLAKYNGISDFSFINTVLTDGKRLIATRYTNDKPTNASTLYYSEGNKYECDGDVCRMHTTDDHRDKAVLIVSEKLTTEEKDWNPIPVNSIMTVDTNLDVNMKEIKF